MKYFTISFVLFCIAGLSFVAGYFAIGSGNSVSYADVYSEKERREALKTYPNYLKNISETDYPTNTTFVNPYMYGTEPHWIPRKKFSPRDLPLVLYEVSRYPNAKPKPKDFERAWDLYNYSYELADKHDWWNFTKATKLYNAELAGQHWARMHNRTIDNRGVLFTKPSDLIFKTQPKTGKKVLVGMDWKLPQGSRRNGEQLAGPLTTWHSHPEFRGKGSGPITGGGDSSLLRYIPRHTNLTVADITKGKYSSVEEYLEDFQGTLTSQMMHVWLAKHPEGPFGSTMYIPRESVKQPKKMNKSTFVRYANKTYYDHRYVK